MAPPASLYISITQLILAASYKRTSNVRKKPFLIFFYFFINDSLVVQQHVAVLCAKVPGWGEVQCPNKDRSGGDEGGGDAKRRLSTHVPDLR